MSILHIIKCEVCEKRCEVSLMQKDAEYKQLPPQWFTLFPGDGRDGMHFCDEACLAIWRLTTLSIPPRQQEPQEQSDCKARRFLLVDGETAEITEGVLWSDGSVILEDGDPPYETWNKFKSAHEGSGVQWIDRDDLPPPTTGYSGYHPPMKTGGYSIHFPKLLGDDQEAAE